MEVPRPSTAEWHPDSGEIARLALHVATNLELPRAGASEMSSDYESDDLGTFEQALDFLNSVSRHEYMHGSTEEIRKGFGTRLSAYQCSLPFDEAERSWLLDTYDRSIGAHDRMLHELSLGKSQMEDDVEEPNYVMKIFLQQEGTIVSAGLTKSVAVGQLFERWSQWRAGEGTFHGEPTVRRTQTSLHTIIDFLLRPGEPRSLEDLLQ